MRADITKDWSMRMAVLEGDAEIGAGRLALLTDPLALQPFPGPEPLEAGPPRFERFDGAAIWARLTPEQQAALGTAAIELAVARFGVEVARNEREEQLFLDAEEGRDGSARRARGRARIRPRRGPARPGAEHPLARGASTTSSTENAELGHRPGAVEVCNRGTAFARPAASTTPAHRRSVWTPRSPAPPITDPLLTAPNRRAAPTLRLTSCPPPA